MRIVAEQFLERPPTSLAPLYVVHGVEPLGTLEAADRLRTLAHAKGYIEREVFTVESGFDWSSLLAASNALSLFATQRLIELRIPTGKPGKEGAQVIERFCDALPDDTVTLITLPEIDWQGKQTKWFMALEANAVMIESPLVSREQLPRWLNTRLQRANLRADADALEFLADCVEGNLLAAKQEIEKLALLRTADDAASISLAMMEASVANVSRYSAAGLLAAIHAADTPRITRTLDGLKAEGEPPPLILWMLTAELRTLLRMAGVTKSGRAPFPTKARELEKLMRKHTTTNLVRLNLQAAKIDRMIKGVNGNDVWDALLQFACGLAGSRLHVQIPANN